MPLPVVLCVEDDDAILDLHTIVLERAGYTVMSAGGATEALRLLLENHIDVVVSDHVHPEPAGLDLFRAMKQHKPEVPILLCTGLVEPPPEALYANDFLVKTAGSRALLEHVAALLRQSPAQKEKTGETPSS